MLARNILPRSDSLAMNPYPRLGLSSNIFWRPSAYCARAPNDEPVSVITSVTPEVTKSSDIFSNPSPPPSSITTPSSTAPSSPASSIPLPAVRKIPCPDNSNTVGIATMEASRYERKNVSNKPKPKSHRRNIGLDTPRASSKKATMKAGGGGGRGGGGAGRGGARAGGGGGGEY